jgi:hypothetical protein
VDRRFEEATDLRLDRAARREIPSEQEIHEGNQARSDPWLGFWWRDGEGSTVGERRAIFRRPELGRGQGGLAFDS